MKQNYKRTTRAIKVKSIKNERITNKNKNNNDKNNNNDSSNDNNHNNKMIVMRTTIVNCVKI